MADWLALPPVRSLEGELRVPSSKSASNRALLLAALTETPVEIRRPLESDDTRALARCLAAMGAAIVPTESGLRVSGPLRGRGGEAVVLDAGDSGTAARFLAAAAAATPGRFRLGGSARLEERPIGELVDALRSAGGADRLRGPRGLPAAGDRRAAPSAPARSPWTRRGRASSFPPCSSRPSSWTAASACARPDRSSPSRTSRPPSRSSGTSGTRLSPERRSRCALERGSPASYETPGDYSSAVPLAAAVGAAGGEVTLRGLRWPSADADAAALPVLRAMGVGIEASAERVVVTVLGRRAARRLDGCVRLSRRGSRPGGAGDAVSRRERVLAHRKPPPQRERPHRGARSPGGRGRGEGPRCGRRAVRRERTRSRRVRRARSDLSRSPHRHGGVRSSRFAVRACSSKTPDASRSRIPPSSATSSGSPSADVVSQVPLSFGIRPGFSGPDSDAASLAAGSFFGFRLGFADPKADAAFLAAGSRQ